MIILTKLNGVSFALNADLIETIEENPDTTIKLTSKTIFIVKESIQDVIAKIIDYRIKISDVLNRIEHCQHDNDLLHQEGSR